MNLQATVEIFGYGTSEGVKKEWDTRGRKGHQLEADKDGALHITDTYPHPYEPKMLKSWYRVTGHDGTIPMGDLPVPASRRDPGVYSIPGGGTVGIDPNKKPDKAEQFDIPKPKSKLETRWHEGSWQKKMKSGWKFV